jgi:hypothetical protein
MAPAGAAAASKAAAQVAARTILRMSPPSRNGCPARPNRLVSADRCDSLKSLAEQVLKPVFSDYLTK